MATIPLRPPLEVVFGALSEVGQPALLESFQPRCCIAAARLAMTVFEWTGYSARPQPMWARAGNAMFSDAVLHSIPLDRWEDAGVRYVEIDTSGNSGGYPGHLVVIVRDHLVDLSSSQFARPEKGIDVPATVILDLPGDWETKPIMKRLDDGGALLYRVHDVDHDYRKSPDWRFRSRTERAAVATMLAMGVSV